MKIRKGFVTNSSSSSFIVVFSETKDLQVSEKVKEEIVSQVLKKALSSGYEEVSTLQELREYYEKEQGEPINDLLCQRWFDAKGYELQQDAIKAGNKIRFYTIHTDDDDLWDLGYQLVSQIFQGMNSDKVIVIGDGSF